MNRYYKPNTDMIEIFGPTWIGPARFEPWKMELVARYEAPPDSDGQTVEIYCTMTPSEFYTLLALEGNGQQAFEFGTGSGMARLIAGMGKAIAGGLLVLKQTTTPI